MANRTANSRMRWLTMYDSTANRPAVARASAAMPIDKNARITDRLLRIMPSYAAENGATVAAALAGRVEFNVRIMRTAAAGALPETRATTSHWRLLCSPTLE